MGVEAGALVEGLVWVWGGRGGGAGGRAGAGGGRGGVCGGEGLGAVGRGEDWAWVLELARCVETAAVGRWTGWGWGWAGRAPPEEERGLRVAEVWWEGCGWAAACGEAEGAWVAVG